MPTRFALAAAAFTAMFSLPSVSEAHWWGHHHRHVAAAAGATTATGCFLTGWLHRCQALLGQLWGSAYVAQLQQFGGTS
jgi:hypothetical protein